MNNEVLECLQTEDWAGLIAALNTYGLADAGEGDLALVEEIAHCETLSELHQRIGGTPADGGRIGRAYEQAQQALRLFDPARVKVVKAAMGVGSE